MAISATLSALSTLNSLFKSEGLSLVLEECLQLLSLLWDCCPKLGSLWLSILLSTLALSPDLGYFQGDGLILITASSKWIISFLFWSVDQFAFPRATATQIDCIQTHVILFVIFVMNSREKTRAKMHNLLLICTSYKILPLNVTICEQKIYLPN